MADIIRRAYHTDIGMICGGCIRADQVYPSGKLSLRDILNIFPFEDPCVVLKLTGQLIWDTLENAVSMVPKQDGRFPQVSGMRFVYDPNATPGKRVAEVYVHGELIDLEKSYTVATRYYMSIGRDGFTALTKGEVLMPDENGHLLSSLLRNYFWAVEVVNKMLAKQVNRDQISTAIKKLNLIDEDTPSPHNIVISPQVQGRILTVYEVKQHGTSLLRFATLPPQIQTFADLKGLPTDEKDDELELLDQQIGRKEVKIAKK